MKRTIVVSLLLLGLTMLFSPNFTIAQLSPLCISQFALANQACAVLPSQEAPSARNQTRSQDDENDDISNNDDDDYDDDDNNKGNSKGDGRDRRRKHGKKHKGRKHGKKHGRDHKEPRANKDCCRWLEELNESCVCGALLRLPPFLVKPRHEYSIKVGNSCRFTYNCYGV